MQTTKPLALGELIELSLDQHMEMVALLRNLQHLLDNQSYAGLLTLNEALCSLQDQIRETDSLLLGELTGARIPADLTPLLDRRTSLQKELLQLLSGILPGAKSIKSFLAREMQTLKTGRNALSGYKSQAPRHGVMINSTS